MKGLAVLIAIFLVGIMVVVKYWEMQGLAAVTNLSLAEGPVGAILGGNEGWTRLLKRSSPGLKVLKKVGG
jgi:hypothetical protein